MCAVRNRFRCVERTVPRLGATLAALLVLGWSEPARASLYCEIRPTRDGFVALRGGPAVAAPLRERMRPGDEIRLGQRSRGDWVEVAYWRGGRFANGDAAGGPPTAEGWMNRRLIARDSCG